MSAVLSKPQSLTRGLTLPDALIVASDMRPMDWECVRAVMGDVTADVFAANRWQTDGPAWVMDENGIPAAMFGLSFSSPWMAVAWFVATPRFHSWKKLIRFARIVRGNLAAHGKHRVEAHVLSGWPEASRLAKRLGLVYEGTRRKAGRMGESIDMHGMTL